MHLSNSDDELRRLLEEEVASVSFKEACRLTPCGPTKGHELVHSGEWESFLDGKSRRVTVRSLIKRRNRLLAAAHATSRRTPPLPQAKPATTETETAT
jgi:hypothetical protein